MNKELKKLMTNVAKGEITMKEAESSIKPTKDENQMVETSPEMPQEEHETQKRPTKSKGRLK